MTNDQFPIKMTPQSNQSLDRSSESEWSSALEEQRQPTLILKENDLFLITDRLGNTIGHNAYQNATVTGLFCRDSRFLSRSELQIEGRSPILLSSTADTGYSLSVACTNPPIERHLKPDSIGIIRHLVLCGGLFEEIEVCNYNTHAVSFQLSLSFNADFRDLFEVRQYNERSQRGQPLPTRSDKPVIPSIPGQPQLTFAYRGLDDSLMETRIEFSHPSPQDIQGYTAIWHLQLGARESQTLGYRLQTLTNDRPNSKQNIPLTLAQARSQAQQKQQDWQQHSTQIRTDRVLLNQTIEQAERDIYLLLQSFGDRKVLAAGIPWFSALFGRDSLIAASQTLMLDPTIARDTLLVLARYQGTADRDWHDESPGKILHELRFGEMARCREIPHTPYYGTVDATPLWLMLYADYYAWTGDRQTLESLWPHALAAMEWIDAQCRDTGYLSYFRRSTGGIDNQGWKDSGDCIVNGKGQLVEGPIALCEVQAYVYGAKLRSSEMARKLNHSELADRWFSEAQSLKERFNRDFWLESENFCALALDGEGNVVDSITSNPGHCLDLGIFTHEKAEAVAERLLAPDLFSGWGIRTLSALSPAYNPIGYHLGTVWPHDNALIAVGLRSLGRVDRAFAVAQGLFDMTGHQPDRRPPELFCGFERQGDRPPINYPVACSPQAWATGSIFQLLQMMVNPIPDGENHRLTLKNPALPTQIDCLSLRNLRVGSARVDLDFEGRGTETTVKVVEQQGNLEVVVEP